MMSRIFLFSVFFQGLFSVSYLELELEWQRAREPERMPYHRDPVCTDDARGGLAPPCGQKSMPTKSASKTLSMWSEKYANEKCIKDTFFGPAVALISVSFHCPAAALRCGLKRRLSSGSGRRRRVHLCSNSFNLKFVSSPGVGRTRIAGAARGARPVRHQPATRTAGQCH